MNIRDGFRIEVMPLTMGRARLIETDGLYVDRSW